MIPATAWDPPAHPPYGHPITGRQWRVIFRVLEREIAALRRATKTGRVLGREKAARRALLLRGIHADASTLAAAITAGETPEQWATRAASVAAALRLFLPAAPRPGADA